MIFILCYPVDLLLRFLLLEVLDLFYDSLVLILLLYLLGLLHGVLFLDLSVLEEFGLHLLPFLCQLSLSLLLLRRTLSRIGSYIGAKGPAVLLALVLNWEVLDDLSDVGLFLLVILVRFVLLLLVNVGQNIAIIEIFNAFRHLALSIPMLPLGLGILLLDLLQGCLLRLDLFLLLRLRLIVLGQLFLPSVGCGSHHFLPASVVILLLGSQVFSQLPRSTLRQHLLIVFLILINVVLVGSIFSKHIEILYILLLLILDPLALLSYLS